MVQTIVRLWSDSISDIVQTKNRLWSDFSERTDFWSDLPGQSDLWSETLLKHVREFKYRDNICVELKKLSAADNSFQSIQIESVFLK